MVNCYRNVVDQNGVFVTTVLMCDNYGKPLNHPYCYDLKPGEQLIESPPPSPALVKARWSGNGWEESATAAEIAAAEAEREAEIPDEIDIPPTDLELFAAEVTTILADMQHQNDLAIAELTTLIALENGGKQNVK